MVQYQKSLNESMDSYDMIICGTSVHDGVLPEQFKEFVNRHALNQEFRVTGLFVLSMKGTDITKQVLEKELPEPARKRLTPVGYLGVRILKEKLSFLNEGSSDRFQRKISRWLGLTM